MALATAAGLIARGQYRLAKQLREEQAQPYVVVFTESSAAGDWVIDLVVKNFGTTAAKDIRIEFDPPLQRAAGGNDDKPKVPAVIPVLVPQQEWRTFWDTGIARAESDLPDRHVATVRFADSRGRAMPQYEFVLDWEPMKQRDVVTIYGAHDAAIALREMSKEVKKWREGGSGGLKVYARDGDARDKRMREAMEERRAARKEAEQPAADENVE